MAECSKFEVSKDLPLEMLYSGPEKLTFPHQTVSLVTPRKDFSVSAGQ